MNGMEALLITGIFLFSMMVAREALAVQTVRLEVAERPVVLSKLKSPQRQAKYRIARTC